MPVLFDTSIYIQSLRVGGASFLSGRWFQSTPIWLSSVVLEELYAGADAKGQRVIDKMARDFDRARRILVPNLTDWISAGRLLASVAQKYGYERIGRAKLTNDALIAASASRAGIALVTANRRDFALLSEFCPLEWRQEAIS